ncbi:translationally-controlled tumor protein [Aspergillus tamarii]|uniref:Translationally-controlled tumor protein homolog n=1 Tax=Aspergillus tamarii TaxID=41984 RepID=A0A5N6V4N0_ASPTM|nr:translationally-controlled tumor protein [Aspergillus tamarii]
MIIYEDILTGDEIISDTFKLKVVDNVLFECDCKNITKKTNEDIQLEGANPSAEGGDEDAGGDADTVQVLDIVDNFRLQEYPKLDKEGYKKYIKGYMKKILGALEEKGAPKETIDEFKNNAQAGLKRILANYKNYDVFVGESFDGDAMQVLVDYREDGVTPYATFWKHGLKENKV